MTSGTLAAVTVADKGRPFGVGHHMVFAAGFAPIGGIRPGIFASFRGLGEGGVDQGPLPVDRVGTVEFGQQDRVQLEPDTGPMPESQVGPAGPAAATAEFGGQIVPGDAGLEDEQDAREDLAVVQGLAAREAEAA